MHRDLVTGGTGLLGSHLICSLLRNGRSVRATKRSSSSTSVFEKVCSLYHVNPSAVEWVEAPLDDVYALADAIHACDTVYHAAGMVTFYRCDRHELFETNVGGTANLVNACLAAQNRPFFVHVSSIAALGRSALDGVLNENNVWEDSPLNTQYARSKYLGECEVWRGFEEGLRGFILNPGVIIGAGDGKSGSNLFFEKLAAGLRFYPAGSNGFVSVKDCVRMLLDFRNREINHERFIAVGANLPYKTLLGMMAESMGVKAPSKPVAGLIYRAAYLFSAVFEPLLGKRLPFSHENIRVSHHNALYSTAKAEALGFRFESINHTIAETVAELGLKPRE
jgi:dihydroflavonol-4-reductase